MSKADPTYGRTGWARAAAARILSDEETLAAFDAGLLDGVPSDVAAAVEAARPERYDYSGDSHLLRAWD